MRIGDPIPFTREALEARAEAADRENMCDACAGGHPISGKPCMCGGSGKMSSAARYLREQLVASEARAEAAEKALRALDAAVSEALCKGNAVIAPVVREELSKALRSARLAGSR